MSSVSSWCALSSNVDNNDNEDSWSCISNNNENVNDDNKDQQFSIIQSTQSQSSGMYIVERTNFLYFLQNKLNLAL